MAGTIQPNSTLLNSNQATPKMRNTSTRGLGESPKRGFVPGELAGRRSHQHGRERTDKLIYSPEGNTVFNISDSMFSCHFSLCSETFHCSVQLLDGGRQGLNTTGCSTATQVGEQMKQGVLWTAVAVMVELPTLFSQTVSLAYVLEKALTQRKASLPQLTREINCLSTSFFSCLVSRHLKRDSTWILSSLRLHLC